MKRYSLLEDRQRLPTSQSTPEEQRSQLPKLKRTEQHAMPANLQSGHA